MARRDDYLVERRAGRRIGVVGGRQVGTEIRRRRDAVRSGFVLLPSDDNGSRSRVLWVVTAGKGGNVLGLALVQAAVGGGRGWWDVGHGGVVGRGGIKVRA